MKRSNIIIISTVAAIIVTVIVVLSIVYSSSQNTSSVAMRTNADYVTAITKAVPGLLDNNQPIFTINSVTKLDTNWYVVVIKSNQNDDTLRALIFDSTVATDTVSLVLGPSISFDKSEIPTSISLPDKIYQEFIK